MGNKMGLALSVLLALGATAGATEVHDLGNIVVTAARVPQTQKETPTSITVVDSKALEESGATTLGDALESITGLNYSYAAGRTHVTIRGTEARHTLILINGRRIANDVSKTLANPDVLTTIGMEDVERIEVVKGASSALYGSEAIGGVINIITKKETEPKFRFGGNISDLSDAEDPVFDYQLSYDSGTKDAFRYRFSYGGRKLPKQINDMESTPFYFGMVHPFSTHLAYAFDSDHELSFDYDYQKFNQAMLGGWTYETKMKVIMVGGKPKRVPYRAKVRAHDRSNVMRTRNMALKYEGKDGVWDYHIDAYRNQFTKDYYTHLDEKILDTDYTNHTETVLEAQGSVRLGEQHRLTVGAEYREEKGVSTRMKTDKPVGEYIVGNAKPRMKYEMDVKYHSVYAQDEWRPHDKWLVVPALRYDHSDRFGNRLSPKLGATYFAADDTRVKFNVGTGYVTPGIMELNYAFTMYANRYMGPRLGLVTYDWVGNANLKPEKSLNYELSLEKDFAQGNAKLSYFHNSIDDYILAVRIHDETTAKPMKRTHWVYQNQNISKARIQGVELSGTRRLNDDWSLRAGYTWMDAIDKNAHTRLADVPRHKIDFGAYYTHGRFGASLWGNYYIDFLNTANLDDRRHAKSEDFLVANVLFHYRLPSGTRFYVGVNNLFDSDTTVRNYFGRQFRVGMEMEW